MAPHRARVSFASAKIGSFSETTKFLPPFLVYFAVFSSLFHRFFKVLWRNRRKSDPDGIQTHDLQNRNLTLYSAKLRSLIPCKNTAFLRLDQTILLFHPFAIHWLWRILHCACNTLRPSSHSLRTSHKKTPTFSEKSPTFFRKSPTFFAEHRR